MQEEKNTNTIQEDEIDLIQLAKTLWNGRRTVIKTTIIFMILGLFVALFSAKQYTASTTMVPQSAAGGSKLGGGLGGLAAMAGINLGDMGGSSDIPPSLYPQIVNSIPFQKELMQTPLTIEKQEEDVTFAEYYLEIAETNLLGYVKKYTIGLPRLIISATMNAIRGNRGDVLHTSLNPNPTGPLRLSGEEKSLCEILNGSIDLEINDKDGYISLSARMPEAEAAAQLTLKAQELLQEAITNFKIKKAKDQLAFVEERYAEKQKEFDAAQKKLAQFRDRNKNVSTAIAQTEQERLQAEYQLAYGVYSELAKQLETQKIKVKEDTPVFTTIQPVSVPLERSKPKRALIFVIWTFLGGILGVGIVFGKVFWLGVKDKWKEE